MVNRRVIFCAWLSALAAVLALSASGCDDRRETYVIIELPRDMYEFDYDVYFTWKNYGEASEPCDAVYIWDGKEVGRGEVGFESILSRLRQLPRGSTVLLYPNYWVNRNPPLNMCEGVVIFPFEDDRDLLREVAKESKLQVIWSPYDHTGTLHPQVREVWDALVEQQRAAEQRKREKAARKYSGDVSEDGKLRMVNLFNLRRRGVFDIALCPSTREILICFGDDKAYQCNIDTKKCLRSYTVNPESKVYGVALSPDGRWGALLVDPGNQRYRQLMIIDTVEGILAGSSDISRLSHSVKFSNTGRYLLVTLLRYGAPEPVAYDLSGRRIEANVPAGFSQPQSKLRAIRDQFGKTNPGLSLYDSNENEILRIEVDHWVDNFGITDDNRYIATVTWDKELIVWRTSDGSEVYRYDLKTSCYLRYDPVENQFLLANFEDYGSKYLRALQIRE